MSDGASDPTRLVDLDEGLSSMGSDLRVARSKAATYDVDAGLMRFSALIAAAPVAAAIGSAAGAAPGGALAPGALGAGSAGATSAASAAATSAATTTAGTSAITATGAAAKAAVAVKLGFGMKTVVAAILATGAFGVAGYEVATRGGSTPRAAEFAGHDRAQTTDEAQKAPSPVDGARRVEAPQSAESDGPTVAPNEPLEPGPRSPTETRVDSPAGVALPTGDSRSPARSSAEPTAAPTPAPSSNGVLVASVKPEMEQLARVRSAGDAARRLRLAEEGHRVFPRGVFFQEREAIAIDALVDLGRSSEAATRARAYVARYPKSPYVETFRRIAGD